MRHTGHDISRGAFLMGALAGSLTPLAGILAAPGATYAAEARASVRAAASLGPLLNIPQTWNNCGPASIAEVLAYWGIARTQGEVQAVLRVDGPRAGMTMYGVPSYARSLGMRALIGVGGTERLIKLLIMGGFPVIVHQVVSLADPVGHLRPIEAYDDGQGVFVSSDPYLGPNHAIAYADFARMWALRGQTFIVLYPPARQAVLNAAIATSGWNKAAAYAHDLALVNSYQLDVTPAGTPASASAGYHYLALAWDSAQIGRTTAARAYARQAAQDGANPIEVRWVSAAIG